MKQFKNKPTKVNIPDMEKSTQTQIVFKEATFADLALIVVRAPKREGFGVEEMRQRFKLIDELENLGPKASVKLEDVDASTLQTLVADYKWEAMDKEIIDFVDYIAGLESVKK